MLIMLENEKPKTKKTEMYEKMYYPLFNQISRSIETLEKIIELTISSVENNDSSMDILSVIRHLADNEIISLKLAQQNSEKTYIEFSL